MPYRIAIGVITISLLFSCAQTPVQYKVAKVVDHESTLLPSELPLSITQERLGENKYRITAKLAELDTHKRALSMALYHASLLAEQKGFDAFILEKSWPASWCSHSRNPNSIRPHAVEGGPTSKIEIKLVDSAKTDTSKSLFLVKNTKIQQKSIMDTVISEIELKRTSDERLEHCNSNRSK